MPGGAAAFFKVVIGAAAATSTATAIAAAVVRFAAVAAISNYVGKRAQNFDAGLRARTLTTRGTTEPQKLIYGEALVSGALAVPPQALGPDNRDLWNIVVLAGHECDSITDVHLDSRVITNSLINGGAAAGGSVTSGQFGPVGGLDVVQIYKYLGTSTQTVNTNFQSAIGSVTWPAEARGRGLCYLVTRFSLYERTEKLWEIGEPSNIKAIVRGKRVYDPRLDTSPGANPDNATYIAWSDNPALCAADFLRDTKFGPLSSLGRGIPAARIDWTAVANAANDCDVLVSVPGGTQKRFTCNGVLYGSNDPDSNFSAILSSMAGVCTLVGDTYRIRAGVYEGPTTGIKLTADDLAGPLGVTKGADPNERVNTSKAVFIDPENDYQPRETAEIDISAYVTTRDKGVVHPRPLELPMTNDWYMAQRLLLRELTLKNQQMTLKGRFNLKAMNLACGDAVELSIDERGWTDRIFRVRKWRLVFGEEIYVDLELQEDDAAAYADPLESDYNTKTAAGALVEADPVPIPDLYAYPPGLGVDSAWSIRAFPDVPDAGEIRLSAGKLALPDGFVLTLASTLDVLTPWEGGETPPNGVGYLIYRKDVGVNGTFCPAFYDRARDQWYTVDDSNVETAFTPDPDVDKLIGRIIATSGSGIDYFSPVIPYVNDPEATVNTGALADLDTVGTDEIDSGAVTISYSDTDASETTNLLNDTVATVSIPAQSVAYDVLVVATCSGWENTRNTPVGPPAWTMQVENDYDALVASVVMADDGVETAEPGRQYTIQKTFSFPASTAVDVELHWIGATLGDIAELRDIQLTALVTLR